MVMVSLHYWAGARAAAGVEAEAFSTASIAEALRLAEATRDDRFSRVVQACSLLIDGVAASPGDLDRILVEPVRVDVLPPFAGGASDRNHATRLSCHLIASRMLDRRLII